MFLLEALFFERQGSVPACSRMRFSLRLYLRFSLRLSLRFWQNYLWNSRMQLSSAGLLPEESLMSRSGFTCGRSFKGLMWGSYSLYSLKSFQGESQVKNLLNRFCSKRRRIYLSEVCEHINLLSFWSLKKLFERRQSGICTVEVKLPQVCKLEKAFYLVKPFVWRKQLKCAGFVRSDHRINKNSQNPGKTNFSLRRCAGLGTTGAV